MSISSHSNSSSLTPIAPRANGAAWRDYPAGIIDGHDAITTTAAAKSLSERLSRLSEILFSDEIDLRVVDVRCDNGNVKIYVDDARNQGDTTAGPC